jgi:ribonuclease D
MAFRAKLDSGPVFVTFCGLIKRIFSRFFKPAPLPTHYPREWVSTPAALKRTVAAIKSSKKVYFDLEADSMHHYYAKICLMQILANGRCYLVDPLEKLDLRPLLVALSEKPIIGHGIDYDLRMLFAEHGFKPLEIFDTMLAAQLLGRSAFGLAALVQEFFGITLVKEGQKADWSRRPLTADLVEYAAQDTFFLPELHAALTAELDSRGRLSWHKESCTSLIRATQRVKDVDPDLSWRITGSTRFNQRQLAILKAMWEVREQYGRDRDLPSYKILPADILLRFAESVPEEGSPAETTRLPSRLHPDLREDLLEAFEDALASGPDAWPLPLPPPKRPARAPHPELLLEMRDVRDGIAKKLQLDPSLLAPKAMMLAAALALTKADASSETQRAETIRAGVQWMKWQEGLLLPGWTKLAEKYRRKH